MKQEVLSKPLFVPALIFLVMVAVVAATGVVCRATVLRQRTLEELNIGLLAAAERGDASAVEALLARGAAVDARRLSRPRRFFDSFLDLRTRLEYRDYPFQIGYTPLMLACIGGHREVARVLLEHGADPNARECAGDPSRSPTALSFAINYCKPEMVSLLAAHGVEANLNGEAMQRWTQFCTRCTLYGYSGGGRE